jgi:hypothetical protein
MDIDLDGSIDVNRENCGVVYLIYGAPDLHERSTPGGAPGILSLK